MKKTQIISISIPEVLFRKLEEKAKLSGKTRSRIVIEALEAYLYQEKILYQPVSFPKWQEPKNQNHIKINPEKFW